MWGAKHFEIVLESRFKGLTSQDKNGIEEYPSDTKLILKSCQLLKWIKKSVQHSARMRNVNVSTMWESLFGGVLGGCLGWAKCIKVWFSLDPQPSGSASNNNFMEGEGCLASRILVLLYGSVVGCVQTYKGGGGIQQWWVPFHEWGQRSELSLNAILSHPFPGDVRLKWIKSSLLLHFLFSCSLPSWRWSPNILKFHSYLYENKKQATSLSP